MAPNVEPYQHQTTSGFQSNDEGNNKRALIGIDGKWYDVTNFLDHHPGGPILRTFINTDATEQFRAYHDPSVLGKRKPVGTYDRKDIRFSNTDAKPEVVEKYLEIEKDYQELNDFFRREGWYITDLFWFARQCLLCAFLFTLSVYGIVVYSDVYKTATPLVCGVLLAAFWQQCGFMMHDLMHCSVFQKRKVDHALGRFFGTVGLGIPSPWWDDEHTIHHLLTNTFSYHLEDKQRPDFDIQMIQKAWTQDEQLLQFCNGEAKNQKLPGLERWLMGYLVSIQHLTFIPLCVFLGRFGIILDSYQNEPRKAEFDLLRIHWAWISLVLLQFPDWKCALIYYCTAAICQGILHIQLLISHFAEPFEEVENSLSKQMFFTHQLNACTNITNPWYTDWFYGGLNFHIEHHTFPRLPRSRLRQAAPYLRQLCDKHGLEYKEATFFQVVRKVIVKLKNVKTLLEFPDVRH